MTTMITPNSPDPVTTANDNPAVPSLDSIAQKMAAMREQTERNLLRATEQTATGIEEESSEPVAHESVEPEVADTEDTEYASDDLNTDAPEEVSPDNSNSSADDLIDFIEFAETNPNAKFKFTRNGKEVVIDAKRAAAILGQGGAIHEDARQLKVERAEFDEYLQAQRAQQEGLTLAMEFTVEPRLQGAYDEIVKTQGYQTTFQQQLAATQDPGQQARIQASMRQNEQYIRQQQSVIGELKPAVDQFRQVRRNQVSERLDAARKGFQDKELRNEYVYNELRDKVEAGQFDKCNTITLAREFEPILSYLCLAWHLRHLTDAEIGSLSTQLLSGLEAMLPVWRWNLRLVALEEAGPEGQGASSEGGGI